MTYVHITYFFNKIHDWIMIMSANNFKFKL